MPAPKVVFDCMIYVQAAARRRGPARACFDAAVARQIELFISPETLAELHDVLSRPELRMRFSELTDTRASRFLAEVLACTSLIASVPIACSHPLDKKDEPYVNLALAASADYVVSRDQRHMLVLMDRSKPHGLDFTNRFPKLAVITPETLLELLRAHT